MYKFDSQEPLIDYLLNEYLITKEQYKILYKFKRAFLKKKEQNISFSYEEKIGKTYKQKDGTETLEIFKSQLDYMKFINNYPVNWELIEFYVNLRMCDIYELLQIHKKSYQAFENDILKICNMLDLIVDFKKTLDY